MARIDAIAGSRAEVVVHIVAALEAHVPFNEARIARMSDPAGLNAWANYHLGLGHLYRFTTADTALAHVCFERALTADPQFARAYAGLSFTSSLRPCCA
ncbi:hypothetical protein [Microvirga antarctica]|uniref:hypothetical protein n=1 Tax=Microvirga antarctica TaxID=2819233 RepID=UPI001B30A945|nr:hypothetical protein [Microvirga antarctica]